MTHNRCLANEVRSRDDGSRPVLRLPVVDEKGVPCCVAIRNHGRVLVVLRRRADFLRPHCGWKASASAVVGTVTLRIDSLPPGVYAAQAFHDENGNRTLDRSFLNLPEGGMGFSRDASMRMGPPRFADAAFTVDGPVTAVDFRLRYR